MPSAVVASTLAAGLFALLGCGAVDADDELTFAPPLAPGRVYVMSVDADAGLVIISDPEGHEPPRVIVDHPAARHGIVADDGALWFGEPWGTALRFEPVFEGDAPSAPVELTIECGDRVNPVLFGGAGSGVRHCCREDGNFDRWQCFEGDTRLVGFESWGRPLALGDDGTVLLERSVVIAEDTTTDLGGRTLVAARAVPGGGYRGVFWDEDNEEVLVAIGTDGAVETLGSFGSLFPTFEGERWNPIYSPVLAADGVLYTIARRLPDPTFRVFARTLDGTTRALAVLEPASSFEFVTGR